MSAPPDRIRRLGVVGYELEGQRSGVGRYLEGLLGGVLESDDSREWLVFCVGKPFEHPLFDQVGAGGARIAPIFDRRPKERPIPWEQLRLPSLLHQHRVDALFSPGYSLPEWPPIPKVVTLHDLSFEHRPEEFRFRERWRRRFLARRAAQGAARVLADTTAGARDLERTYRLDPRRIGIVPLAVDSTFFAAEPVSESGAPYLVALGSILPRRRLDLAIAAFARIAADHATLRLVIAGRNRLPDPTDLDRWIEGSGVAERIDRRDYIAEAELPPLLAGAEATLYLSTYEGYGLPPLESLAAGSLPIVAPGQALDDLWPDYPLTSDSTVDAVTATLRHALELGSADRRALVADGRQRLRQLDWRSCAERFLAELSIAFGSTG